MLKVRLNSAAQVTKDTLISQLKTLGCVYQVSSDKKTIAFGYGTAIKTAPIVLTYTFQTGACAIAYNTAPIQNIRVDRLKATVKSSRIRSSKGSRASPSWHNGYPKPGQVKLHFYLPDIS